MVKLSEMVWMALRRDIAAGTATSTELADRLEKATGPIPNDVRRAMAARLRLAPEPGRQRGRPRQNSEDKAGAAYRAILFANMTNLHWAMAGGQRGKKTEAIKQTAARFRLSPATVEKILSHELRRARQAYPRTPYFTLQSWLEFLKSQAATED